MRVHAASVGPRDVRMAHQRAGLWPGSDFAGVIERGGGRSGPQVGDHVVGVVPRGGLAERIAVPSKSLCRIVEQIDFATAAATAAAGLTALYALERCGSLIGRRVLVTAAGGAVGLLACQLVQIGGGSAVRWTRGTTAVTRLTDRGVHVVPSESLATAELGGRFDLVIEMVVGEPWLEHCARWLRAESSSS